MTSRDQHGVNNLADIPILDQMQPVHPSDHDFLPARTVDRSTNTR